MSFRAKELFTNARIALWRRHRYRSLLDVPKDFLLRCASDFRRPSGCAPVAFPMSLRLRVLSDPIYVRPANSDFLVFGEVFDRGEYAAVKQWDLPTDARIVDLGANIGLASVYFASLLPEVSVLAVEPDAENCRLIEKNCRRLSEDRRLRITRAFVAARDGVAGIDRAGSSWGFRKIDRIDAGGEAVPCISMSRLLETSGFDRVDLLKCDIEGSERELFKDCSGWIERVNHLVVETHKPYTNADLYNDLRSSGWQFEVTSELHGEADGIVFLKKR